MVLPAHKICWKEKSEVAMSITAPVRNSEPRILMSPRTHSRSVGAVRQLAQSIVLDRERWDSTGWLIELPPGLAWWPTRETSKMVPEPHVAHEQADALERDMSGLRELLSSSRVTEARALIKELAVRWPDSVRVQHMAKVLAPPVARAVPGPPHRSLDRELTWYKYHGHEHPGCWMGVLGDRLLAADPSYKTMYDLLSTTPGSGDAVIFFQPPDRY